jgi:hypothetical protein
LVTPIAPRDLRGADILSDCIIGHHAAESTEIRDIPRDRGRFTPMPEQIPTKLRSRRVRVHVETTLICIRRMNMQRDAVRVRAIDEVSWESLDLYTLALDTAEDDGLRALVLQARGAIQSALLTRSACR